ncbi:MAG: SH3 domain-containing protein [Desulfobulbaceae bacterium]|nr:SH3 domain-containing protein [Desulfobulbaceae bacterium]
MNSKSFILLCLLVLLLPAVSLAKMVSISGDEVNLRISPTTNSKVKWVLGKGFPLQVIGHKGKWLKVRDFENDTGWVFASLTSSKAHMVVKKKIINIRSGPGTKYRIIAQAKYGVVFRTIKQVKGWAKVRHQNGTTGWVSRKLLWGW